MNWTDVPDCDVPLIVVETEVWPAWRKVLADLEPNYSGTAAESLIQALGSASEINGIHRSPYRPDLRPYVFIVAFEGDQFRLLAEAHGKESFLSDLMEYIVPRFADLITSCPVGGVSLWSEDQWREFDRPTGDRIPHTDYHQYIGSDEWREKATMAKENAGQRCQVCNGTYRLEAHHRTYERLGFEDKGDITVLCRDCHQVFHDNGRLVT